MMPVARPLRKRGKGGEERGLKETFKNQATMTVGAVFKAKKKKKKFKGMGKPVAAK